MRRREGAWGTWGHPDRARAGTDLPQPALPRTLPPHMDTSADTGLTAGVRMRPCSTGQGPGTTVPPTHLVREGRGEAARASSGARAGCCLGSPVATAGNWPPSPASVVPGWAAPPVPPHPPALLPWGWSSLTLPSHTPSMDPHTGTPTPSGLVPPIPGPCSPGSSLPGLGAPTPPQGSLHTGAHVGGSHVPPRCIFQFGRGRPEPGALSHVCGQGGESARGGAVCGTPCLGTPSRWVRKRPGSEARTCTAGGPLRETRCY